MFWKKKEAPVVQSAPIDHMKEACDAYGRPDLRHHLSYVIMTNPAGKDVDRLAKKETWPHYILIGNVALHRGKVDEAHGYFEKAAELIESAGKNIPTATHLAPIIANWEVAAKIVRSYWDKLGKV
jgi:hypothetical protein